MKVVNRINNNVVLVSDGIDLMIVTGKGLGFQVNADDDVDESLIEQCYVMQKKNIAQYISILKEIPKEYIDVAKEVVSYGEEKLGKIIPVNLVFALADHFYFAYQRTIKGQQIEHPLKWEIQQLYPVELDIGTHAVKLVNKISPIEISENENVFIAMHFINYGIEGSTSYDPIELAEKLNGSIQILEDYFDQIFDKHSSSFSRFIVHLRFYIIRTMRFESDQSDKTSLLETIKTMYPDAYGCASQITNYLNNGGSLKAQETEKVYLALHINRLIEDRRE